MFIFISEWRRSPCFRRRFSAQKASSQVQETQWAGETGAQVAPRCTWFHCATKQITPKLWRQIRKQNCKNIYILIFQKASKLKGYVVCAGFQYGMGENLFHYFFKVNIINPLWTHNLYKKILPSILVQISYCAWNKTKLTLN